MLTLECLTSRTDPFAFNKSAWFVVSHFQDICDFFGVPLPKRTDRLSALQYFDPDRLSRAIRECAGFVSQGRVFGV
jgi:hypothetical protein